MKMSAHLSYLVAIRRQSLSLAKVFSTLWRCLYWRLQNVAGVLRPLRGGMHGVMPFALSAARYSSLSIGRQALLATPRGIAFIRDHRLSFGQVGIGDFGSDVIGHLSRCERHDDGLAIAINDSVQL